jgi:acetylglutamate kinase
MKARKRAAPAAAEGRLPVRVYKLGGPALEDPGLLPPLAEELRRQPGPVVLVHGGGRHVDRLLQALHVESQFIHGRRVTSPAAMDVVEMVLSGAVNKSLAAQLMQVGVRAVGISGRDGGLLQAELEPGLGRVGTRVRVDPELVLGLWSAGFVPVISPVSSSPTGESLNVNADEAALGLAAGLFARSLVYLSDVDGVKIGGEAVSSLTADAAAGFVSDGTISGGMALKVHIALEAARAGVAEVVIAGKARLTGGFGGTRILAGSSKEARA